MTTGHIAPLLRRQSRSCILHLCKTIQCRFKSHRSSKLKNQHESDRINTFFEEQSRKRKHRGHNPDAITKGEEGTEFRNYRLKMPKCESIKEIDSILNFNFNLDVKVYTAAIKRAGQLKDVQYCMELMDFILNASDLSPDHTLFGTLFHAFNANRKPLFADKYLDIMINKCHIIPDVVSATALLGGCTESGDVERAEKILQDVFVKYDITPNNLTFTELIHIYGKAGQYKAARMCFDSIIEYGIMADVSNYGAMTSAYLINDQIDEALRLKDKMDTKGFELNIAGYMPFITHYLKDNYLNPSKSLTLLKECRERYNIVSLEADLLSVELVAYLKWLEQTDDNQKRQKCFDCIVKVAEEEY